MQAGFVCDMFSWRRTGLAEVRVKGTGSGHGKVRAALGKGKGGQSKGGKSPRSFVLRTYIVGGKGVKKLHVN